MNKQDIACSSFFLPVFYGGFGAYGYMCNSIEYNLNKATDEKRT